MSVGVSDADSSPVEASPPRLLGRDQELTELFGLIDSIGERGGALVVRGDAGIGKSVLLEAGADRARRQQVAVASAVGIQSEASFALPDCTSSFCRSSTHGTTCPTPSAVRSRPLSVSPTARPRIRSWSDLRPSGS